MTTISRLATLLALSPGDVRTVLGRGPRLPMLLTGAQARFARAVLDGDGSRVEWR